MSLSHRQGGDWRPVRLIGLQECEYVILYRIVLCQHCQRREPDAIYMNAGGIGDAEGDVGEDRLVFVAASVNKDHRLSRRVRVGQVVPAPGIVTTRQCSSVDAAALGPKTLPMHGQAGQHDTRVHTNVSDKIRG